MRVVKLEDAARRQLQQSPLQIDSKPLFNLTFQRRKTAQVPFRRSLHSNKSPIEKQLPIVDELRRQNYQLEEQKQELLNVNNTLQQQILELQDINKQLSNQILQLSKQIDDLKINNRHLRSQESSLYQQSRSNDQRCPHYISNLQFQMKRLSDQIDHNQKEQQQSKPQKPIKQYYEIDSLLLEMRNHILCKYCNKELRDPVTVIPCAHSYCRCCRKGYFKECYLCGSETEIEASYVNKLLVTMVDLYKKNCEIRKLLEQQQQQQ